ncbi:hypothetical protein ACFPRL_23535 [Pseudoclavibacter helvolus]
MISRARTSPWMLGRAAKSSGAHRCSTGRPARCTSPRPRSTKRSTTASAARSDSSRWTNERASTSTRCSTSRSPTISSQTSTLTRPPLGHQNQQQQQTRTPLSDHRAQPHAIHRLRRRPHRCRPPEDQRQPAAHRVLRRRARTPPGLPV